MNIGFAKGGQVSYKLGSYEFGISFLHAVSQTPSTTKRHGLGYHLKDQGASIQISQERGKHRNEQTTANTSSINIFTGINVLRLFNSDNQHNLTIGVLGGIGLHDSSFMISNANGMTIDIHYGGLWSDGAKASYEYMITERVGTGLSVTYDFPQQNMYGLANLIVRF